MEENTNKTRNQNIGNSPTTTCLQNLGETWYNLNKSGLPCDNLPQNSVTLKRKIVLIYDKRIKLQLKCLLLFYKKCQNNIATHDPGIWPEIIFTHLNLSESSQSYWWLSFLHRKPAVHSAPANTYSQLLPARHGLSDCC